MRKITIILIQLYQRILSPDKGIPKKLGLTKGSTCAFYPTCSEYTIEAVQKYGISKGLFLGIKRILRCHPGQKNHIDPLK